MQRLLQGRNPFILGGILVAIILSVLFVKPAMPTIQLPAEKIPGLSIFGFPVTNTLLATLLADVTLVVLGLLAVRKMRDVPEGLQNLFEWVWEAFDGMITDIAGKDNGRKWMPMFMTVLLFLLIANWWELVPGFDSVGIIEPLEVTYVESGGTVTSGAAKGTFLGLPSIVRPKGAISISLTDEQKQRALEEAEEAEAHGEAYHGPHDPEHASGGYTLLPFFRAAATDLNLPIALALISVGISQVIGIRRLRGKYARRFVAPVYTNNKFIDSLIGVLEFISELAKIVSLSFRLFGNIFAGQVLLFVMAFLLALLLPLPFFGLELFVGFMQAFVFAILTVIYFEQSIHSHAGDEHH
ncbi:MAG: F0F1 ATP synthase subunit A [Caldilineae bacterium]|nr:MAG: F0F1 ATP synthase subunit A [Caldilineae bacterium]